jgi:hypothetical protein
MNNLKTKNSKSSFMSATPVSYRLQFATVAVAFSAVAVQLWFFIPMFTNSGGSPNSSYFWSAATQSLFFPLAVFAIAYLATHSYTAPIGRWFIATIKSFIVIAGSGILMSLWTNITSSYMITDQNSLGSMPPWWITSNLPFYVIMALSLAGMLLYTYRTRE